MRELDILKKYERVEAPEYFEKGVMNLLIQRKKKKQKGRILSLSLAGAVGTLGVLLLVYSIFFFSGGKSIQEFAEKDTERVQAIENYFRIGHENRIPITEAVDYSREIGKQTSQPVTVYILEQVSESTDARTKF